jgi:hypothetical protein
MVEGVVQVQRLCRSPNRQQSRCTVLSPRWRNGNLGMQRYHLDIHKGEDFIEDWEGDRFTDLDSADCAARKSIVELISELLRCKISPVDWSMRIRDGEGRTVRTLAFIDILKSP